MFCGSVSDTLFTKVGNTRHQKDATLSFILAGNGIRNLNCKNVKIADQDGPVAGMWTTLCERVELCGSQTLIYTLSLII
jgi:hypothetical protein